MVRTKVTVRRIPDKIRKLLAWMVNREYGKKKNNLSIQDKTNPTSITDSSHYQERTSFKNRQCKKKIRIFQWKKPLNLIIS